MKAWSHLGWQLGLAFLLVVIATQPGHAWQPSLVAEPDADELLVGLQPNHQLDISIPGMRVVTRIPQLNLVRIRVPAGQVRGTTQALRASQDVAYVEPNGTMSGALLPNDPAFKDPDKVYGPIQIQADRAWNLVLGSASITVAVLDSGLDRYHPELAGDCRINTREIPGNKQDEDGNGYVDDVCGWDFVDKDNDPSDELGHGTHVAGIIAAAMNNGIGLAGIASGVSLLPLRVLDRNNQGTWGDIAEAIVYAADMGAQVINLSLGGNSTSMSVQSAVHYAQQHDVLVVAAAGNNASCQAFFPAAYAGVLGVAATQAQNMVWSGSNYGNYIDLSAPGQNIYSTYWTAAGGSGYQYLSGTSMSAAEVSGAVALIYSANPKLSAVQVSQILTETATDLGAPGWDTHFGCGQVDVYGAVNEALLTAQESGAVQGAAWVDLDRDGKRDSGETNGIAEVRVLLNRTPNQTVHEVVTGNQGTYTLDDLPPGPYTVKAAAPSGWANTTTQTYSLTVAGGQTVAADFGFAEVPQAARRPAIFMPLVKVRTPK
jgi:thermitase